MKNHNIFKSMRNKIVTLCAAMMMCCILPLYAQAQIHTDTICAGDSITFTADTVSHQGSNPMYKWYVNGSLRQNSSSLDFTYQPTSNYDTVVCELVSDENCLTNSVVASQKIVIVVDTCRYDLPEQYWQMQNCSQTDTIKVLANQTMINCNLSTVPVAIVDSSKVGASTIVYNNIILYTPLPGFAGKDTIKYSVLCHDSLFVGTVYITVTPPEDAFSDEIWYFGGYKRTSGAYGTNNPDATSPGIVFRKNSLGKYEPYNASRISRVSTFENSLSISSPYCDGQTIFYASHNQVFNNQHELMTNGVFQGHHSNADGLAACYMGNNKYLFFSVTDAYTASTRGLVAYVVDLNGDYGRGSIIANYQIEAANANMSEVIELVAKAGTPNEYWLIYQYGSNLRCRKVDINAVGNPVNSSYTSTACRSTQATTLVASPQGNRLAMITPTANTNKQVSVFNLNNSSGVITLKADTTANASNAYSAAFSPKGDYLYVGAWSGTTARVMRYHINTGNSISYLDNVQYWEQTDSNSKGGGLKLAPDSNIYVAQAFSNWVGRIDYPDSNASLSSRYVRHGFNLVDTAGVYMTFSTGLTKPGVLPCNTNHPPVAVKDSVFICNTGGNSISINVLLNDYDQDGNQIYLTDAVFQNLNDTNYASLTVNSADSAGIITFKSNVAQMPVGHKFRIWYYIKDNGIPASKCAMGELVVVANPAPTPNVPNQALTYWYGDTSTHTLQGATQAQAANGYTLRWYDDQYNRYYGFNTNINKNDTGLRTYYVSQILNDSSCESDKVPVYVTVLKPSAINYIVCPNDTVNVGVSDIQNVEYYWFASDTATVALAGSPTNTLKYGETSRLPVTIWVEPRIDTIVGKRLHILIQENSYCNGAFSACVDSGTLLFREDFGGNDSLDREIKPCGNPTFVSELPCTDNTASSVPPIVKNTGKYMLAKQAKDFYPGFANVSDNTNLNDTSRGYFLIFDPDTSDLGKVIYSRVITDLCGGMSLSFSAHFSDLNDNNPIAVLPKIELQMVDTSTKTVLVTTGEVIVRGKNWMRYGFDFNLPANVNDVEFRIINREKRTDGNDLGLDDIEIYVCVPKVVVSKGTSDTMVCYKEPLTLTAEYTDDGIFTNNSNKLYYQWQRSTTGDPHGNDWLPVNPQPDSTAGTTINAIHAIPSISGNDTGYYRLIVGNISTINKPNCRAVSNIIKVGMYPLPAVSISDDSVCVNATTQLTPSTGGTWVSLNPSIASVTNDGEVTGISAGNARFVFTLDATGCSDTTTIVRVVALNTPAMPDTILGAYHDLRKGTSGHKFYVDPSVPTLTYNWTLPTGFVITHTSSNRDTIIVSIDANAVAGKITASATSTTGCVDVSDTTWIDVTIHSLVYGTVFPIVHHKEPGNSTIAALNVNFPVIAELYDTLATPCPDPIGTLNTRIPIMIDTARYYIVANMTASDSSYILHITNPGDTITWDSLFNGAPAPHTFANLPPVEKGDPQPADAFTQIGMFAFENVPAGKYILKLSRGGYVTRYAEITVTQSGGSVGHRELILGDVDTNGIIDIRDLEAIHNNGNTWSNAYDSRYDLNADGKIDAADVSAAKAFLGFKREYYLETKEWLKKY